jgi:hypothetical protein
MFRAPQFLAIGALAHGLSALVYGLPMCARAFLPLQNPAGCSDTQSVRTPAGLAFAQSYSCARIVCMFINEEFSTCQTSRTVARSSQENRSAPAKKEKKEGSSRSKGLRARNNNPADRNGAAPAILPMIPEKPARRAARAVSIHTGAHRNSGWALRGGRMPAASFGSPPIFPASC